MSRRLSRRVAATVACSILLAAGFGSGGASADTVDVPAGSTAERTAQQVADAAPADSTINSADKVAAAASPDGASIDVGTARAPLAGTGSVAVDEVGVGIGLPREVPVGAAQITRDGAVVYPGTSDADAAVAVAGSSESVALQVVLPDSSAPTRFTFDIAGATPVIDDEGAALLVDEDARLVGIADAPWATDATGRALPTHYEVQGQSLVQVVDTTGAVFPVVADPDFIFVAKCSAAIALFAAENAALIGKFWRVFKSAKRLIEIFRDIRSMSKAGKISYLKSKLGSVAAELGGFNDLVLRCTP